MVSTVTSCFERVGTFKPEPLRKLLPPEYRLILSAGKPMRGTLLDTFDGHLRRSGSVLLQLKGRILLLDLAEGALFEQPVAMPWRFAAELKGEAVGFRLTRLSSLRAYLPVCDVDLEQAQISLLDDLQKTVVRGRVSILSCGTRKAVWVTTFALRGYDDDAILLNRVLIDAEFAAVREGSDYYPLLGIKRPLYTAKPDVMLDPHEPVFACACRIASSFLEVARANEAGILDDLDTEFVHDYRVSLRRIRSLLTLFRDVFAAEDSQRLKTELAGIMKQTNRLRDLDVYLLDRDRYYSLVPASMHAGLDIMFDVFVRERREMLEQVRTLLHSPEYTLQVDALTACFSETGRLQRGSAADEEALHFARRLILKRYRKVARIALGINADTPDARIHELRIQCKKLRYLMEFFMPFFPQETIRPLVKSLKSLQEGLGLFNDYSVQREALSAFLDEHPMRGRKGIMLAESVGALVATLFQQQQKIRAEIEAGLSGFTDEKTRRRFARVFSNRD